MLDNEIQITIRCGQVTPTGGEITSKIVAENSQYLQSLDHISRKRYFQRLKVLGLAEEDDPYLETKLERFTDEMTAWPQVEFGCIIIWIFHQKAKCFYTRGTIGLEESASSPVSHQNGIESVQVVALFAFSG